MKTLKLLFWATFVVVAFLWDCLFRKDPVVKEAKHGKAE